MYYVYNIAVPKNTTKECPVETLFSLSSGNLQELTIEYPGGCCGLVGVRIFRWHRQIIPNNIEEWLVSDDRVIIINDIYPILQLPYTLRANIYNLDDTYNHTIHITLNVQKRLIF